MYEIYFGYPGIWIERNIRMSNGQPLDLHENHMDNPNVNVRKTHITSRNTRIRRWAREL